jgi:hypothetical protein
MLESISSIAEGILLTDEAELKSTGKVASQHTPTGDLDISNVEVPDSFVDALLTGKPLPVLNEEVVEVVVEKPKESETQSTEQLITELGQIVARAKVIINEMTMGTTVGNIGSSAVERPKKEKRKSSEDEKRKLMLARIKGKITNG